MGAIYQKAYKFGTRLLTDSDDNNYNKHRLVTQRMTTDVKKGNINITNLYAYHWQESPSDIPIIGLLDEHDMTKETVLSPDDERYTEAVAIIISAHEKLAGMDPRLYLDFE